MHFVEFRNYGAGGALPLRVTVLSDAAPFLFRCISFAASKLSYCENYRAPYLRGVARSATRSARKRGQPICCYCCRASVGARSARSACAPQYKSRTLRRARSAPTPPGRLQLMYWLRGVARSATQSARKRGQRSSSH